MFGRVKNFLSKLVPSFSRNEAPPPTANDDSEPGPNSKKYISYECRVCDKTLKLVSRDGIQKAFNHALNHGDLFYYKCQINGCGEEFRAKNQIDYHYKRIHQIEGTVDGHALVDLPLNDPVLRAIIRNSFGSTMMRRMCRKYTRKTKAVNKLAAGVKKMSLK
ncbi:unnamed protein product [Caenorhabditis brenneri]